MPELPEVENVRRSLTNLIVGKTVATIDTDWPKILIGGLDYFQTMLDGATILRIDRRGKYLLIRFDDGMTLVSHLRMEGKYQLVERAAEPKHRFVHVTFTFSDGTQLRYHDMRKFGRMMLVGTGTEMVNVPGLDTIGPEPIPTAFDANEFYDVIHQRRTAIKSVILDQSVVAGVGNIYADETLWMSQIHPEQPANTLFRPEAARLRDAIIEELQTAIDLGGTSVHTFIDANGQRGEMQQHLHVYDRAGTPCDRCGTTIVKIKVGQRGTSFCPQCQKLRRRKPR